MLKKEDGLINWELPAQEIHNRVRGLTPWPGAYTFLNGNMVKILKTEILQGGGEPGRIYSGTEDTLHVGAGNGLLRVLEIQPAGKKPMSAADFLRGHRGIEGKKFTNVQRTRGAKG
jgi:methionyl-tRNA formyltransferase